VLHVYKDVYPPVAGGIEKHIDGLRRATPDCVSVVVVCARAPRTRMSPVGDGVEVGVAEYGPRWLSVPVAPAMPRWIARMDADLIHLHMPNPPGELSVLLARKGRPIVASYHAEIVRQARLERAYRPLASACLRRAAAIVAGTNGMARGEALRPYGSKVEVIRYGVDVDAYDRETVPLARRDELQGIYGTPLILAVGRLVYYKGYKHLIEAARGLDASLVIVGDGPERARLTELARTSSNVHFAGALDESELVEHLAAADCFAMSSTSRAEAFGIATAEAQAMSLPAVVTDTGSGTPESVEHGVTGFVVPPGDPGALRDALTDLLSDDRRRAEMAASARERAERLHDLRARALDLRALYERVVDSTAG
jgi:glycosyltransferase involved in cell wall biosynthesis